MPIEYINSKQKFKMKTFLTILLSIIFFSGFSQIPQGIPYQAAARNATGQILANTQVLLRFSIIDSIANGTMVYQETHNLTTNSMGLFSTNIGMGSAVIGTFNTINWGQNFKFLKVELDTSALGNNYIDMGTQQMMSVPYALFSGFSSQIISSDTNISNFIECYSFEVPNFFGSNSYPLVKSFTLAPNQTIEIDYEISVWGGSGYKSASIGINGITNELIFSNSSLESYSYNITDAKSKGNFVIKNTSSVLKNYSISRANNSTVSSGCNWSLILRKIN